jgi:hypothetical protein
MSKFDDELQQFLWAIESRHDDDNNMRMVYGEDDLSEEMAAIEAEVQAEMELELFEECGLDREDREAA